MAKKSHPRKKARKNNPTSDLTPASHSSPAVSAVPSCLGSAVPSRVASAMPSRVASAVPSRVGSAAPSCILSTDNNDARTSEGGNDEEGLSIEEVDPVKDLGAFPSFFFLTDR